MGEQANSKENKGIDRGALIHTFSEIDSRISALHECSEKDFKQLNTYLKEYHTKTRSIFDNAASIFDLLGGSKGAGLLKDLNEVRLALRESKRKIEENNEENIHVQENILAKVILLTVTLKNFKQDLITYKFLVSNFKLVSGYENFGEEINQFVFTFDSFVRHLRTLIPAMEKNLEEMKTHLYGSISKSKALLERSRSNFRNLFKEVDTCIRLVSQKASESNEGLPMLNQKTENATKNIGSIITHLQYHDIIWQKIEHIKKTHARIISELGSDEDMGGLRKVGDISELQAAQLILVNKEYQGAIEVIIKSFQQMGSDLATVTSLAHDFSFDNKSSEITLINQVKSRLDTGIVVLDLNNYTDLVADQQVLEHKSDDFLSTMGEVKKIMQELKLQSLLKKFRDNKLKQEEQPRVLIQLGNLTREVVRKLGSINEAVEEVAALAKQFITEEIDPDWGHELEKDRIELMIRISRILEVLDADNQQLDDFLSQNGDLSEEILGEIKGAINSVDYYDFFEKVIEEIIQMLNTLNLQLYPEGRPEGDKRDSLSDIKDLYTMQSERIIHDRVESNEGFDGDVDLFDTGDDDDLELF